MKKVGSILVFGLLAISLIRCSVGSSDPFIGEWTQVADLLGNDIKPEKTPIKLRISKQDIFYFIEAYQDGKYEPYPDKSGRYELIDDKKTITSVAFGSKFSIQYRDNSKSLFENAWLGYFKKK